ncbi:MAG: DUF2723 domain-containing protein [Candidatus Margulisiibacteriota bacterium]|nr:DUF2723 domain-containing protein [Candidatus Margulisiibacteriota bacterium]
MTNTRVRADNLVGLLLFLGTFIVYIKTLCPTVPPRDSAELITVAYTLGIAHPPGYPLFTLLGKLFTFIPFGSIAWRVNLLSAFFASLTVWLTYLISLKLTRNIIAGVLSALALAFSLFFWKLAVVAEVFQLNAFFAALLIYIIIIWAEKREIRFLYLFSFIYGLGLTNHHTLILLAPGFAYYVWVNDRTVFFKLGNWGIMAGCFALGLLPYIYLPIRSLQNPYIDWGNPENLKNFINVVTRKQYGGMRLDPNFKNMPFSNPFVQVKVFVYWIYQNFTILGLVAGILGIIKNIRNNIRVFGFLISVFLMTGLAFMLLANYPLERELFYPYITAILGRFMLPALLIFAIWIGIGVTCVSNKKAALLFLIIPLLSLTLHYKEADRSRYYFAEDVLNNIFLSIKPNSILFASGDTTLFGCWYMQQVRGVRKDIKVISSKQYDWRAAQILKRWPNLTKRKIDSYKSEYEFIDDIIKNNLNKARVYSDLYQPYKFKKYGKHLAPNGLIFEFITNPSRQAKKRHMLKNNYLWGQYRFKSPLSTANPNDYFSVEIVDYYKMAKMISGRLTTPSVPRP